MTRFGADASASHAAQARLGTIVAERYRLEAILGSGGAGVLYRARHVRTGRAVAVKLLHATSADQTMATLRLEREAIAAVELEHPHVVEVLDFGEDPSGAPYLIMELLHGHTLQDELEQNGTIPAQRMFDLLVPIMGALQVAHERGVLHRDVKPANLFVVEQSGGAAHAKLLDFGIALVEGAAKLTQPGRVVGTIGFMSPEQVHGEPLTPASDLWSLAAVMFRCLTGKLPREASATLSLSASAIASQPGLVGVEAQPLLLVIGRALENDPAARFPDAYAFARALVAAAHYAGLTLPESPEPIGLPDWPTWRQAVTLEDATIAPIEAVSASASQPTAAAPAARSSTGRAREGSVLLDRFLLKRLLGSGAMGVVYEAEHLGIQRPCAIKLLHPSLSADAGLRQRFRKEAQRAGRIVHENVVSVTDYDVDADTPFLVMELLRGDSLRDLLDRTGALPVERALQMGVQMARGLAAAHELGVVHRDLKPQNVFVTRRADGSDHVKLLDFGVAKALHGDQSGVDTQAGALLGTVRYMAPEQLRSSKDVDSRADVYAAGLIVYEMLAGRPAFDANELHASMHQLLYERPPALAELRPGLPPALLATIDKAMQRAADDRFASASELADTLQAVITNPSASMLVPKAAPVPAAAAAPTAASATSPAASSTSASAPRTQLRWVIAALVLAVIGASAWLLRSNASTPQAPTANTASPSPSSLPPAAAPSALPAVVEPAPQPAAAAAEPPAPTAPAATTTGASTTPSTGTPAAGTGDARTRPRPRPHAPGAARKPGSSLDFDDRNPYE